MTRHKRHGIKLKSMYQWHRYVGITIAVFVVLLAISGILLNHTSEFELDKRYVNNNALLDHYGIRGPKQVRSFAVNATFVSQWQSRLFLGEEDLGESAMQLTGVVSYQGMIVIGLENSLWLYTPEGELIEKLGGTEGVPAAIDAIGITDKQRFAVKSANGIYSADKDLLIWQKDPQAITVWNDARALPDTLQQNLLDKYRGKGLSLERVILDLHSGRLLGTGGVYFMDFVAVLLTFLACSGLWIWTMRWIKQRQHNKNK